MVARTHEFDSCHTSYPMLSINSRTIHRLIISTVLVAHKFSEDICYRNSWFAALTDLSVDAINQMESQFLYIIDFNLYVGQEELEHFREGVQRFFTEEDNHQVIENISAQIRYAINYT